MADAGKIPLPFQTLLAFGNIFKKSLMLGMAPQSLLLFRKCQIITLQKCLSLDS